MKFFTTVRTTNPETAGQPPAALFHAIMQMGMEAGATLVETGGMSNVGAAKVRHRQTHVDGPYTEAKELVGGYAIFELPTEAEVVRYCERMADLHREHWPAWEGEISALELTVQPMG